MRFVELHGADTVGVSKTLLTVLNELGVPNADSVDAAQDKGAGALRAVQTLSMFEPTRVVLVTTPEKVSVAVARDMAKLTHDGAVIFTGEKAVSAAVRKALPDLETFKHPLPRPRDAYQWVASRFDSADVQLPPSNLHALAEVATTKTGAARVHHLADLLNACGLTTPPGELVDALTHDMGATEAMWVASDAVTRGDLTQARPIDEIEPVVALSMLARRLARIGAALEGQLETPELAKVLEQREVAVRMMTKDVQVSVADVEKAFDLVIDASAMCRRVSDQAMSRAVADQASLRAAELMRPA